MSAGLEFLGVDGWRGLPGWHGPASHVLFETRRGEDENEVDVIVTDVFQAYPRLSGEKNRASSMDVIFLAVQSNVCGARLNEQDLVLLKMLMPRNCTSGWNLFGAKH